MGPDAWSEARRTLQRLLAAGNDELAAVDGALVAQSDADMHLPARIGDYTDFYSSIVHATNVGEMFRSVVTVHVFGVEFSFEFFLFSSPHQSVDMVIDKTRLAGSVSFVKKR